MTIPLLKSLDGLPETVEQPGYDPVGFQTGIVHLGLGAFHKAHQAFYTDHALGISGGDWRIHGVSMRNTTIPELVRRQNGLFTLLTRSEGGTSARVIASIENATCAKTHPAEVLDLLVAPGTRIVSMTVTEKGYGIDRKNGRVDLSNPVISGDLKSQDGPRGVIGMIVEALCRRKEAGTPPFTVLCCDNLPENGVFVKQGVVDFAKRLRPGLADWIEERVPFPSTMVDRITPAQTSDTLELAAAFTGFTDMAAIEAEPFHQWVIEDRFSTGRPDWDLAGAVFTDDVLPFENMKLRMLNGSHSLLAYAGYLSGHQYVRDVMSDENLRLLIKRHLSAAAATLSRVPLDKITAYRTSLLKRFANPNIAHETWQITADGSQKLPQRIFAPALQALELRQDVGSFAFAAAVWMHFCRGTTDTGETFDIVDPLSEELRSVACGNSAGEIVAEFSAIPGLIPASLSQNRTWNAAVISRLENLLSKGAAFTVMQEAERSRD